MIHSIEAFGAVAGGERVNTAAIQAAVDALGGEGGRIVVPPGVWLTGTVRLRSGCELHLYPGAVLKGTDNPEDYPPDCPVEAGVVRSRRAFDRRIVYACGAQDVSVTGPGLIDGAGGCAAHSFPRGNEGRPANIQFVACRRATVRDVALRCSGSWMQQYLACEELFLHNLRVWNHGNKTNDGLDIDGCADVLVSDCDIDSHDDALVFKSTGPAPCRNIAVSNCRLRSNCHGIKFGTESVGGFENIRIANCIISPSREAAPLEGFPDGRPVITGCAFECADGGIMRGITVTGLTVERVFAPVFIKLGNRHDRRLGDEPFRGAGALEDIRVTDVLARSCGPHVCSVTGYPGHPVRRIHLGGFRGDYCGGVSAEAVMETVPENSDAYPEINMFQKTGGRNTGKHLPAWGFYIRHAADVSLADIAFRLLAPDARHPIVAEDVSGLRLRDVRMGDRCDGECVHYPAQRPR